MRVKIVVRTLVKGIVKLMLLHLLEAEPRLTWRFMGFLKPVQCRTFHIVKCCVVTFKCSLMSFCFVEFVALKAFEL